MYLCKRKAYKFCNLVTLIFLSVTIISCSFSPINSDTKIIVSKVKFDISVPEKIRNNINTFIIEKDLSTKEVAFSEFKFKENDFFGGENSLIAWQAALIMMGLGSLIVFVIQFKFRSKDLFRRY